MFFKVKTKLYNIYKIKFHKTSKCLWPVSIGMFDLKWMCFFRRFHKSLNVKIKNVTYLYLLKAGFNVAEFAEQTKHSMRQFLWCWIPSCTILFKTRFKQGYWCASLLFQNNKRDNKCFNNHCHSLFFLTNIF